MPKPFLLSKWSYYFTYIAPTVHKAFTGDYLRWKWGLEKASNFPKEAKLQILTCSFLRVGKSLSPSPAGYLVEQVIPLEQMTLQLLGKTIKDA